MKNFDQNESPEDESKFFLLKKTIQQFLHIKGEGLTAGMVSQVVWNGLGVGVSK